MVRLLVVLFLANATNTTFAVNNGSLPFSINDSRSRQPIAGATACIQVGTWCATTDIHGQGVIDSIEPGLYSITVSASGYDTVIEPNVLVKTGVNTTIALILNQSITDLTKITVTGHELNAKAPSQSTSVTRFTSYELSNTPGTANDINRVLASHPSVVSGGSEFDNTLYVRGGHSCENVFVVDGIEFENTNHFAAIGQSGGSIGFINSTLIRDLEFYTGGFPASMPPRLSSVVNVNLRNGSMNAFKTQVDLNMSGLGLVLESPLPNTKGSWIANVRFIDLRFLKPFLTLKGVPRFGDGFLKMTFLPSDYSTITATAVTSMDTYIEEEDLSDYPVPTTYKESLRQYGGIVSWNYNKNNLQNSLSISGTRADRLYYDDALHFDGPILLDSVVANMSVYRINHTIVDTLVLPTDTLQQLSFRYAKKRLNGGTDSRWLSSFKDDISISFGGLHRIEAGFNANYRRYNIGNENSFEAQRIYMTYVIGIDTILKIQNKAWYTDSILDIASAGGYAEYILEAGPIKTIAGLRSDYYDVITDYGISPRLGFRFNGNRLGEFSLSAGLYYQFPADFSGLIRTLIANDPNSGFTDEVPLGEARLQRNWQTVLGYELFLGKSHSMTIETYYKWYDREYPFITPGERQYYTSGYNPVRQSQDYFTWKLSDPDGKKRSYGLELMFQKKQYTNFYYSGAYSIFNIENKYTNGKWYHDEMDVGQVLNLSVGTNVFKHHGFALRAQIANGRRYTPVIYNQLTRQFDLDYTEEYCSRHLPVNASLNFRYTFKSFLAWGNITGYIEVMNLLNYTIVVERYFDPYSESGYRDFKCNGILPVAGITADF
jgi:hypothetical protein